MAIGFPPEYTEDYAAHHLKRAQKIALVHLALEKKAWEITHLGTQRIIAGISYSVEDKLAIEPVTLKVHNLTITLNEHSITIKSESAVEGNNGKNRKMVYALMESLNQLKEQYSGEELVAHYNTIKHEVVEEALPKQEYGYEAYQPPEAPQTTQEKIGSYLAMFKPAQGYKATPIIMWLNTIIFLIMVLSGVHIVEPSIPDLIAWGANYPPSTLDGEPWRFLTSTFLHIGILHLLMNMYALIFIGALLEPLIGTTRFTIAYILTGIIASATSLYWHDTTVSAGASGAIFGMYGLFLALLSVNIIAKEARKALLSSIGIFVIFNLVSGMKEGIDNAAHIGGLVSGLVIGYLLILSIRKPTHKQLKITTLAIATAATIVVAIIAYNKKPSDVGIFQKKIEQFSTLEKEALELYNLPDNTTQKEYEIAIADGILKWHQCVELLDEMKDLDLPSEFREQIALLKAYCNIRATTFATQGRYIKSPNPELLLEIEDLGNKTDSLLQVINE